MQPQRLQDSFEVIPFVVYLIFGDIYIVLYCALCSRFIALVFWMFFSAVLFAIYSGESARCFGQPCLFVFGHINVSDVCMMHLCLDVNGAGFVEVSVENGDTDLDHLLDYVCATAARGDLPAAVVSASSGGATSSVADSLGAPSNSFLMPSVPPKACSVKCPPAKAVATEDAATAQKASPPHVPFVKEAMFLQTGSMSCGQGFPLPPPMDAGVAAGSTEVPQAKAAFAMMPPTGVRVKAAAPPPVPPKLSFLNGLPIFGGKRKSFSI